MQSVQDVEQHVPVREGDYGERVATVEPGGVEYIALKERHGKPIDLLWTWLSPNLEFATVFVGVLGVAIFGLSFWETAVAILVGTALGSATHYVLSSWGPKFGVPMMVESRGAFGFLGNILPAGLNGLTGSIGWFIVNSVSGAFALLALVNLGSSWFWLGFLVIVVAQVLVATFGYNFIHLFERYALPLLGIVFILATVFIFSHANVGAGAAAGTNHFAAFTLLLTATFGYAAGWNPYAADYTRYMAPTVDRRAVGLWAAAGVFISCVVIELAGAALATVSGTKWGPNDIPTVQLSVAMPSWLYYLTLLGIAVGAVCANAINIYSGTMSLVALGIREMGMTLRQRRAALAVAVGILGYIIGIVGQANVGPGSKYQSFLLLISYWIGCWLAVVFVDYWMRKGDYGDESLFFNPRYQRWQGFAAMAIGLIVSVGLFGNVYGVYVGPIPNNNPGIGDVTFFVGFVMTAVLYYVFQMVGRTQTASSAVGSRA
ncbi:MAG TPA: cytosine permease [Candidatus Dormibacteraeota bacterium]|nr:cytosine permease [Candidatus Dormibacteraeota bacterium]